MNNFLENTYIKNGFNIFKNPVDTYKHERN